MPAATSVQPATARTIAFGAFTFDRVSQLLRRDGVEVPMPPRVLGVLTLLLERPGDVVTKQELITAVWRDAFVTETSLAEAISLLRQTLGDDPQRPAYIQTQHRRGYRFIAEIRDVTAPVPVLPPAPVLVPAPTTGVVPSADPPPRLSLLVPWLVAGFSLLVAAVAVWKVVSTTAPAAPAPVQFTWPLPPGLTIAEAGVPVALAHDGSLVAFAGCDGTRCAIYLRPFAGDAVTPVAGTTGGSSPFFSTDGRTLGFFADGSLQTIPLGGGAPRRVTDAADPRGAVWLRDGQIVFGTADRGLFVTTPAGGHVRALTTPAAGEGGHHWPAALPDASAVLFTVAAPAGGSDRPYGAIASMRTGAWGRVLDSVDAVRVPRPDYLVAQRGERLVASWFDPRAHSVVGLPVAVAGPPLSGGPGFSVNDAGTLVAVGPGRDALHVVLHWAGQLPRLVPAPPPALPR